jgi:hypothetical protein
LRHNDKKVKASGQIPGCHARVQQTIEPKETESIWLSTVRSGYLRRVVAVSLLLVLCSAGYIVAVECCANCSRISPTAEDQSSIVVSGDVDQQRDAVLANFAKYGNRLERNNPRGTKFKYCGRTDRMGE